MDMFDTHHPDDELLASLADGDEAGVPADAREHVAACDRCRAVVAELERLQAALAELPDLSPPRPLRLVPPVPEPEARGGWLVRLRRLTAPAMTLAAVMIVVGAVGTAAPLAGGAGTASLTSNYFQAPAAAPPAASAAREQAASPSARAYAGAIDNAAGTPTPAPKPALGPVTSPAPTTKALFGSVTGPTPAPELGQSPPATNQGAGPTGFEWLLAAGVLLLAAAFAVRAVAARRRLGPGSA